jgi:hypothetical protein
VGEPALDFLFDGLSAADDVVAKAVGISEVARIAKIETRLREYMEAKWNKLSAEALRKAVSMAKKLRPAGEISRAIDKILGRWGREVSPRVEKDFIRMYELARTAGWKKGRGDSRAPLTYDLPPLEDVEKADIWKRLWETEPDQRPTSEATAVNTLPTVFRQMPLRRGTVNADLGGGPYEAATEFLRRRGVENVVFDPFRRSEEHKQAAADKIRDGQADTATVANVLNVIRSPGDRDTVIRQAANAVGKTGVAYFQVYEGDRSGKGAMSSRGWQANRPLEFFEPEIKRHFASVERDGDVLIARQGVEVKKANDAALMAGIKPSFDVIDTAAAEALAENQVFWVGEHYHANMADAIAEQTRLSMIEAGRDRAAAGVLMQERMAREFGMVRTPAGWNGTSRQYFEGLAAHAATTARVHGQMRSFVDLGVTRYQIANPVDERTCRICGHMDGKVINVEHGMKVMEAELNAVSPEEVKSAHPWLQDSKAGLEKLKEVAPRRGEQRNEAKRAAESKNLGEAGLSLPPFHFRCRCTVDVSYQAGSFNAMTPMERPPPAPKKKVPASTVKHVHRLKVASDLAESPVVKAEALMAESANETLLVEVRTAKGERVKGVFKPASGEYSGLRPNIKSGTFYQREAFVSELDVELGGPSIVPTTVARKVKGEIGSYQKWVDDAKDYKDVSRAVRESAEFFKTDPRARKMHLMDLLGANDDRHRGNIMFQWVKGKKGKKVLKVWAIDNGLTFPAGKPARFLSPYPGRTYKAFRRLDEASIKMLNDLDNRVFAEMMKRNGLERKAARGALQRLEALRKNPNIMEKYGVPDPWGGPGPNRFFTELEDTPLKFISKKKVANIEKLLDDVYGKA